MYHHDRRVTHFFCFFIFKGGSNMCFRIAVITKNVFILGFIISLLFLVKGVGFVHAEDSFSPEGPIRSDGEQMVWISMIEGQSQIIYVDSNGVKQSITDHESQKKNPDISGQYIVWQDNRNDTDTAVPQFDIYLYDILTKKEMRLSNSNDSHEEPRIDGQYVVWLEKKDGQSNVMLYDTETGTLDHITTGVRAFGAKTDGNQVVWMQYNSPFFDIYSSDLETQTNKQITYGGGHHKDPHIYDNKIVWHDYREGHRNIYLHDVDSGTAVNLTPSEGNKTIKGFYEGQLLYENENTQQVLLQDTVSGTEEEIKISSTSQQILFHGDTLKVISENGITSYTTRDVIQSGDRGDSRKDSGSDNLTVEEVQYVTSADHVLIIHLKNIKQGELSIVEHENTSIPGLVTNGTSYEVITSKELDYSIELNFTLHELDQRLTVYGIRENKWINLGGGLNSNERVVTVNLGEINQFILAYPKLKFVDVVNHWAEEAIHLLYAHNIVNGYNGTEFRPNQTVTRAEFIKIIVDAMKLEKGTATLEFNDVTKNHWALDEIEIAASLKIVTGDGENYYPSKPISREEIVSILRRVSQLTNEVNESNSNLLASYSDKNEVSAWSQAAFEFALEQGLISGKTNHLLAPKADATRAEAVSFVVRLLDYLKGVKLNEA
jgi:beta propeller repeat protein